MNQHISNARVSNTGSPQGCVLVHLLFVMCTDSCRTSQEGSYLVKFSDDTIVLSLPKDSESDHGCALPAFVKWCDDNFLNMSKTKGTHH